MRGSLSYILLGLAMMFAPAVSVNAATAAAPIDPGRMTGLYHVENSANISGARSFAAGSTTAATAVSYQGSIRVSFAPAQSALGDRPADGYFTFLPASSGFNGKHIAIGSNIGLLAGVGAHLTGA